MAVVAAASSLVLIAVITLFMLLIQKEIFGGLRSEHAKRLSQALNVSIVPLIIVFVAALVVQLVDTLR
jgi:hypothetical protein